MKSQTTDLHSPTPDLMKLVRAGFVSKGTSLTQWCKIQGISRMWAVLALTGKRNGPAAIELRKRLMRESGLCR